MARATPSKTHGRSEVHERAPLVRAVAQEKKRLGRRVRGLREARDWSRETAAEHIGIHAVHVARVELGNANVTLATLVAMARAYGVRLADLFAEG